MDSYLDEEINVWNKLAVCGDVGPLKSNTDSYAVILSSASQVCLYGWQCKNRGQLADLGDYRPKYCIFSIDVLEQLSLHLFTLLMFIQLSF